MKTIYRNEQLKIEKAVIEDFFEYLYFSERLTINGKIFEIVKILVDEDTNTRTVYMKEPDNKKFSLLDYKIRKQRI